MWFDVSVVSTAQREWFAPSFLRLAGHPIRWRLLQELAHGDRRVGELGGLVGQPQSLVSYHLGRLRGEGLVSVRRSSADRRDSYYSLDLVRCGQLLAATGGALHPGLAVSPPTPCWEGRRSSGARVDVLFLCTGNSARSQIAEALLERLSHGDARAFSAGSHPKPLHRNAVRVMRERGIDIAGRRSKHLSEFTGRHLDYVVSLCDRVREVCLEFPARPDLIHWSIPDPSREGDSDAETSPAFQRTADELTTRVGFLLARIESTKEANR